MGGEGKIVYNVMNIRRILVWELGGGDGGHGSYCSE